MEDKELIDKYKATCKEIAKACKECGRDPESVKLIVVTKGHQAEAIKTLYAAGHRDFGENYQQELSAKAAQLKGLDIRWHFIGHLQTNKLSKILEHASMVHTLSSPRHAESLENILKLKSRQKFPVFIEVNLASEASKGGVSLQETQTLIKHIQQNCPHLEVAGLMAVPPSNITDAAYGDTLPESYRQLSRAASSIGHGQLSLGMSSDFHLAIRAGSNYVRIGTRILGPRTRSGD